MNLRQINACVNLFETPQVCLWTAYVRKVARGLVLGFHHRSIHPPSVKTAVDQMADGAVIVVMHVI